MWKSLNQSFLIKRLKFFLILRQTAMIIPIYHWNDLIFQDTQSENIDGEWRNCKSDHSFQSHSTSVLVFRLHCYCSLFAARVYVWHWHLVEVSETHRQTCFSHNIQTKNSVARLGKFPSNWTSCDQAGPKKNALGRWTKSGMNLLNNWCFFFFLINFFVWSLF